jgi:hypothetical protein
MPSVDVVVVASTPVVDVELDVAVLDDVDVDEVDEVAVVDVVVGTGCSCWSSSMSRSRWRSSSAWWSTRTSSWTRTDDELDVLVELEVLDVEVVVG